MIIKPELAMNNEQVEKVSLLYIQLCNAENELFCFTQAASLMDSGEENWVRDQERHISSLRAQIDYVRNNKE